MPEPEQETFGTRYMARRVKEEPKTPPKNQRHKNQPNYGPHSSSLPPNRFRSYGLHYSTFFFLVAPHCTRRYDFSASNRLKNSCDSLLSQSREPIALPTIWPRLLMMVLTGSAQAW